MCLRRRSWTPAAGRGASRSSAPGDRRNGRRSGGAGSRRPCGYAARAVGADVVRRFWSAARPMPSRAAQHDRGWVVRAGVRRRHLQDRATYVASAAAGVSRDPGARRRCGARSRRRCERGRMIGECANFAREPGERAGERAARRGIRRSRRRGRARRGSRRRRARRGRAFANWACGCCWRVAQGSAQPPRVIVLRHEPPGAPAAPVLGLVGKGITFDTGGISIKPADGMERMKDDMAGGAAVAGAMLRARALEVRRSRSSASSRRRRTCSAAARSGRAT